MPSLAVVLTKNTPANHKWAVLQSFPEYLLGEESEDRRRKKILRYFDKMYLKVPQSLQKIQLQMLLFPSMNEKHLSTLVLVGVKDRKMGTCRMNRL